MKINELKPRGGYKDIEKMASQEAIPYYGMQDYVAMFGLAKNHLTKGYRKQTKTSRRLTFC